MKSKALVFGSLLFVLGTISFGTGSQEFRTCFLPYEDCRARLIDFLSAAEASIDIAIYHLKDPSVLETLAKKSEEGVKVRIVLDTEKATKRAQQIEKLEKHGVHLRYGVQEGNMHNKFALVDGEDLEVGSMNYTKNSFQKNQENSIFTTNPVLVSQYQSYFERLWDSSEK